MTIQKIAQKQLDQPATFYFARKGTSDCYWFDHDCIRSYSNTLQEGHRAALDIYDLAATDWRVITPSR